MLFRSIKAFWTSSLAAEMEYRVNFVVAMLTSVGIGAVFAALVATLLAIPLLMAYWFAPALVVFRNEEPMSAMKTLAIGRRPSTRRPTSTSETALEAIRCARPKA